MKKEKMPKPVKFDDNLFLKSVINKAIGGNIRIFSVDSWLLTDFEMELILMKHQKEKSINNKILLLPHRKIVVPNNVTIDIEDIEDANWYYSEISDGLLMTARSIKVLTATCCHYEYLYEWLNHVVDIFKYSECLKEIFIKAINETYDYIKTLKYKYEKIGDLEQQQLIISWKIIEKTVQHQDTKKLKPLSIASHYIFIDVTFQFMSQLISKTLIRTQRCCVDFLSKMKVLTFTYDENDEIFEPIETELLLSWTNLLHDLRKKITLSIENIGDLLLKAIKKNSDSLVDEVEDKLDIFLEHVRELIFIRNELQISQYIYYWMKNINHERLKDLWIVICKQYNSWDRLEGLINHLLEIHEQSIILEEQNIIKKERKSIKLSHCIKQQIIDSPFEDFIALKHKTMQRGNDAVWQQLTMKQFLSSIKNTTSISTKNQKQRKRKKKHKITESKTTQITTK